jgi:hypothetical protein
MGFLRFFRGYFTDSRPATPRCHSLDRAAPHSLAQRRRPAFRRAVAAALAWRWRASGVRAILAA